MARIRIGATVDKSLLQEGSAAAIRTNDAGLLDEPLAEVVARHHPPSGTLAIRCEVGDATKA